MYEGKLEDRQQSVVSRDASQKEVTKQQVCTELEKNDEHELRKVGKVNEKGGQTWWGGDCSCCKEMDT